jgi:hypothetical protein
MTRTLPILLIASLSALAAWQLKPEKAQLPPAPALVSVQEMGALVSLKVNYANVIEFNERVTRDIPWTQWELRLGGTRVLLVARGECLIGTDLKQAKYEPSDATTRTATLVLPQPTVISARLNQDANSGGSYFYAVSSTGIEALVPGSDGQTKAINSALQKGQRDVEASCAKPELIEAARKSALAVLLPTVSATGWKVAVVWR